MCMPVQYEMHGLSFVTEGFIILNYCSQKIIVCLALSLAKEQLYVNL